MAWYKKDEPKGIKKEKKIEPDGPNIPVEKKDPYTSIIGRSDVFEPEKPKRKSK